MGQTPNQSGCWSASPHSSNPPENPDEMDDRSIHTDNAGEGHTQNHHHLTGIPLPLGKNINLNLTEDRPQISDLAQGDPSSRILRNILEIPYIKHLQKGELIGELTLLMHLQAHCILFYPIKVHRGGRGEGSKSVKSC